MGTRTASRLIEALGHADPNVRRCASRLLGDSPRGADAAPRLAAVIFDRFGALRVAAGVALRKINV